METKDKTRCTCGSPFPMHIAKMLTDHVCICERSYKVKDSEFIPNGTEMNPFARYDRALAAKAAKAVRRA